MASPKRGNNFSNPVGNIESTANVDEGDQARMSGAGHEFEDGSSGETNVQAISQMSPDISLSSQHTLRYCDVEAAEQQEPRDTSHDESSDSIETLNEPPAHDTHVELNNKILEQLSLTCQNLKNSVESHQRAERERQENKSPMEDADGFVSSGDSHEVIPESGNILRPESLSLPRPLQSIEREKKERAARSNSHQPESVHPPQTIHQPQRDQTDALLEERAAHCIDSKNLPISSTSSTASTSASSLPSGTIVRKGRMIEFVADNLEEMIKLSSPLAGQDSGSAGSRRSSLRSTVSASSSTSFATSSGPSQSPNSLLQQSPVDIPPVDAAAVIELENHARRVADSLDHMMGNIGNNLHKMSAITIGCEDAYKRSVDITCDSVDSSIKSMYALMAKCEELSAGMGPVAQLAAQIKEIKRILDLFESQLSDK